jgi:tRNA A-37 threonylcarbamoyl transferase component Bud32
MSASPSNAALAPAGALPAAPDACPPDRTLVRLVEGRLDDERQRALRAHCDGCALCASALVELAHTLAPASPSPAPPPDEWLGERYKLLAPLGAGGMGVVQAAFDTQLRRKVAVKRLREAGGDAALERRRARFLREARLLASLSHPNVLTVHDVGGMDGELYVVMELVDGWPMSRFISESRPGPSEIVDLYLQAGRGLAAAHALGVVHRDVKPENILVARSGRVLIGDFGLAGLTQTGAAARAPAAPPASLTETGAVLGTPAYMAPELHDGGAADARSDQFAFCTSLWESLHGGRPFEGASAAALRAAMRRGPPPSGRGAVPRTIDRVLARGLAEDPRGRHASMDALLAELSRARRQGRPGRAVVALAGVLAAATLAAASSRHGRSPAASAAQDALAAAPSASAASKASAAPAGGASASASFAEDAPLILASAFVPSSHPGRAQPPASAERARQRATPGRRAPPAHARAVALVARDADPALVLLLADGAHADRDGASCLAALGRVPAGAWPTELDVRARRRRATCEMLRGRCGEGRRLFAAVEGGDAARAAALTDCPVGALATIEDRLTAVATQADEARYAGNAPKRRADLERLLAREAQAPELEACLRHAPGARACDRRLGLLARAYQVVAESFLTGHDCAVGAALDVLRTEVQLETTGPVGGDRAVGCRAERAREIFPECRVAAEQAERRCVARVQAALHDGMSALPTSPR